MKYFFFHELANINKETVNTKKVSKVYNSLTLLFSRQTRCIVTIGGGVLNIWAI